MLYVKTPEEVLALIESEFFPLEQAEFVALSEAVGRVLAEDIVAREYVPDFDRSTVDGFAVRASDTFGCSDAIPAILPLQATVLMGEGADYLLNEGECVAVPTGGADPNPVTADNLDEYRMLDEWMIEFLGEGRRRTDLIRWDKFVTESWWDHTPLNDKNKNLFPIPNSAISANNLIEQNPGY